MVVENKFKRLEQEVDVVVTQARGFLTRDDIIRRVEEFYDQALSVPASEVSAAHLRTAIAFAIKNLTQRRRILVTQYEGREVYVPQERVVGSIYGRGMETT